MRKADAQSSVNALVRADLIVYYTVKSTVNGHLDLEDQVKSLVAQVNEANAAKEAMWERFKHVA